METIKITAPAKVNLFLAITGRRPDGFHELETIFQAVDLCDTIELKLQPSGITLECDWPDLPVDENNLCWKAAARLQQKNKVAAGVALRLQKQIPPGAGLGGGSSDAAATLLGLNRLWELNLSPEQLQEYAAQLGADVPFFLRGGTAVGKARGETLAAIATPDLWFVIAWPGKILSTAAVYKAWDEQPAGSAISLQQMLDALQPRPLQHIAGLLRNDLEAAAIKLYPACAKLKRELLEAGCPGALVSGSGSAVFGLAGSEHQAHDITAQFSHRHNLWMRIARSISTGEAR
jgi:4-diphosphocytidyl-2-C-methyl-D-erythritol kinase